MGISNEFSVRAIRGHLYLSFQGLGLVSGFADELQNELEFGEFVGLTHTSCFYFLLNIRSLCDDGVDLLYVELDTVGVEGGPSGHGLDDFPRLELTPLDQLVSNQVSRLRAQVAEQRLRLDHFEHSRHPGILSLKVE